MASSLSQRDKGILSSGNSIRIGNKPYENGIYGSNSIRDFIFLEISDIAGNTIEYKNLSFSSIIIDDGGNIKLSPPDNIENAGITAGTFNLTYRFLRRLAGEDKTVLVRTKPDAAGKFLIWDDYLNIEITDDGLVYERVGTERGQELQLKNLKYQIDAISPSRTEVRIRAQDFDGQDYKQDFFNLGIDRRRDINDNVSIEFILNADADNDFNESNTLQIIPPDDGFIFLPKMIGGTITISDVYTVGQDTTFTRTDRNVVPNPSGEQLSLSDMGEPIFLGETYPWDEFLHQKAIQVEGWSTGWLHWYPNSTVWGDSHPIGYYAHWVQGEGVDGGICMKFPDLNAPFAQQYVEWPTNKPHRDLIIWSTIYEQLPQLGVSTNDKAIVSFDIKSSILDNWPMKVYFSYPADIDSEEGFLPAAPPIGFFDPDAPPPDEAMPTSPPDGYVANTVGAAQAIEHKPPRLPGALLRAFPNSNPFPLTFFDGAVGDTTAAWNGEGAWKITAYHNPNTDIDGGAVAGYEWAPSLDTFVLGNRDGTLSDEQVWIWQVDQWIINSDTQNPSFPTAPTGTVFPDDWDDVVNAHPYQVTGQGVPIFTRNTTRGENAGWQTGTQYSNDHYLLFKDDLVWFDQVNSSNDNNIKLMDIETWTNSNVLRNISVTDPAQGQFGFAGATRSLYNDIFEKGFIQSVTRAQQMFNCTVRAGHYIIFYNDGRGNPDTSNKFFQIYIGSGGSGGSSFLVENNSTNIQEVSYLKDFNELLNNEIVENGNKFEVTFWRKTSGQGSDRFRYYWAVGDTVHRSVDGNGDIRNDQFDANDTYPGNINDVFDHVPSQPDAWFPKDATALADHFRYDAIIDTTVHQEDTTKTTNQVFFGAGEVGTGGLELIYGSRNPGATNYNPDAIYDDGTSTFDFAEDPRKLGTLSPGGFYEWTSPNESDGNYHWQYIGQMPPRFIFENSPANTVVASNINEWERVELELSIPDNWRYDGTYFHLFFRLGINNDNDAEGAKQGITWIDNVDLRYELTAPDTIESVDVKKPFVAQIKSVNDLGTIITVDKTFREGALDVGLPVVDDSSAEFDFYQGNPPTSYTGFNAQYLVFNPRELRTYLKFNNQFFLTTNFRQDRGAVVDYPHGIVFKLYEPLPETFEKFDECIVVKEMVYPLTEDVKVVDFVPQETGDIVLKSPDLKNVESPVQRRATDYQNETSILTEDATVSGELRNLFLSQSLESVELNVDHTQYENFINFSSAEERLKNFKYKLELIESYTVESASVANISGSAKDLKLWSGRIEEVKNKFDSFDKYMYFQSSSYVTSSLGEFFNNAWPKTAGSGTLTNPYILAHTTSSAAIDWFNTTQISASNYDLVNENKLSNLLPLHIIDDSNNDSYLKFTDMIGQHFDSIWIYIKGVTDIFDRRESLSEGTSKDLLYSVGKSLGWNMNDGKDLISLSKFALGTEVTGSALSNSTAMSEKDMSREIWSRIINNMPFFLKNKGTVRALKGLINIYGIPSTILRVKEYGGPNLPDDASPQFEITRKFTKALDFRSNQYVKTIWSDDSSTSRKPDTVEFRFRAVTGSNQILVQKEDGNDRSWFIRLKDNGSADNYGNVSFMLSGSKAGVDVGEYKEISSSAMPVYDGDFYSVMLQRSSGSDNPSISQSYELHVGKYDAGRSKIHLYSKSTMAVDVATSSSFNLAWTGSGDVYIGGKETVADVGVRFSGSIMEYRHWTETLNTGSFRNHIGNPKAFDGNTVSSSYNNLVLRYSFDDDKNLLTDTEGIRDVSSNQTTTYSGSHSGFSGNFFSSVVDELKSNIPSIGALRRTTNKIRIESNTIKYGEILQRTKRATVSAYDSAPNDSNKVGIFFAPTDVINRDIIDSVGNLNFDNYLGDPRDKTELNYRGLKYVADNYWKKYKSPMNFWDYIRLLKYYDQSLYPQLRKMVPARANPNIGLLVEPNIFERPKVIMGKAPQGFDLLYTASIDVGAFADSIIQITSSYNNGPAISSYKAYDADIKIYSYDTGSSYVSASGTYNTYDGTVDELKDRAFDISIWQQLGQPGTYTSGSISSGDVKYKEVHQPIISGSRIHGRNQKIMKIYSSVISASLGLASSSSFYNVDIDNQADYDQAKLNSYYLGVKNTDQTTIDGLAPIEVVITSPTKLVTQKSGDSTLKTGDGIVSDFKTDSKNLDQKMTGVSVGGFDASGIRKPFPPGTPGAHLETLMNLEINDAIIDAGGDVGKAAEKIERIRNKFNPELNKLSKGGADPRGKEKGK